MKEHPLVFPDWGAQREKRDLTRRKIGEKKKDSQSNFLDEKPANTTKDGKPRWRVTREVELAEGSVLEPW